MCGLAAAAGPGSETRVHLMLEILGHRGTRPRMVRGDDRRCAVGHVRLPIVGTDPMWDQPVEVRDGQFLAFVGEVLDFRDRDPAFECDLETVADAWVNDGPTGLRDHDGFWSVAVADVREGSVHAFVDYLAQKPLYFRTDVPSVASEPDAVAAVAPVTPDPLYMADVVKWGYCPDRVRTPYNEVRRTPPGAYIKMTRDGLEIRAVSDKLEPAGSPIELKHELEEAVRRRVTSSDVPVSALVSGGLDSAVVYTLARRHRELSPVLHVRNDEYEAFEEVAGGDLNSYLVSTDRVDLDRALSYMQEPIDLGSLVPQVALSDAIGDLATVCLTGDGADEMLGGYGRAQRYDSQASDVWRELVCWHLPRLDRVMMRNRVEVRSPFLARQVARVCLNLPRPLRTDKRALRIIARGWLPRSVTDRPKRPLRTREVEQDREARSLELVQMFKRERLWG